MEKVEDDLLRQKLFWEAYYGVAVPATDEDRDKALKSLKPVTTIEKANAIVHRKLWEIRNIKKEETDPQLTLKPDLSKTCTKTKTFKYHHTGVWMHFEFKDKDSGKIKSEDGWSCCMNIDKESDGCVKTVVDKERWILSSYT